MAAHGPRRGRRPQSDRCGAGPNLWEMEGGNERLEVIFGAWQYTFRLIVIFCGVANTLLVAQAERSGLKNTARRRGIGLTTTPFIL